MRSRWVSWVLWVEWVRWVGWVRWVSASIVLLHGSAECTMLTTRTTAQPIAHNTYNTQ